MLQSGVLPSQLDSQDYMQVLRVLKSKSREDRPLNTEDAHKKLAQMLGN